MQGGSGRDDEVEEELNIGELASNLSTYKQQLHQVCLFFLGLGLGFLFRFHFD